MAETATTRGLYRLLAWVSPSFPTGAFSYSHGLEAAVADGSVRGRAGLEAWIAAIIRHGSGRIDADILRDAYRAVVAGDPAAVDAAKRRGTVFRPTAELALESAQQGNAFLATCVAAWRNPIIAGRRENPHPPSAVADGSPSSAVRDVSGAAERSEVGEDICHSAAFGVAAVGGGIALEHALIAYLHAFAGNLVSAGIRLGVIGQTDGQRILAALERVVAEAAAAAMSRDPADFGSATFAVDLASMAHEAQYSRLFRS